MPSQPARFAVVGAGWRARFFWRLAAAQPLAGSVRCLGVLARSDAARERVYADGVTVFTQLDQVIAAAPDFVIVALPWLAAPEVITELVANGIAVLTETPPAPDEQGLAELWAAVGGSGLVQVAEQYLRMPGHAARKAVVESGLIGRPTGVTVSSTHGYHAVSIMRGMLGAGFGPVTVSATAAVSELVDPADREGWRDDLVAKPARTVVATLAFTNGLGVYDFTDNQWHNHLRSRRIVIRGTRGEIADDSVVAITAPRTIVRSTLERRQVGYDLDLDGFDTDHLSLSGQVLFRNAFLGARLSDEEIAISQLMADMARWCHGRGPAPYPLAEGCQDQLLSLAIDAALEAGTPMIIGPASWSDAG